MMTKLGKHDNKLNSEREGSRPNINLHLAVPLSLGEEEGNGGSGVCVSNTTVKMMKQGNHISLRQGFNQAKKKGEGATAAGAVSHYMQLWGWDPRRSFSR